MKCIYKKRVYKPITKIISYENTFTYITKSNKQYIYPNEEIKLPFSPQDILYHNKFYYINKNKVTYCENDHYNRVRLPVKITNINILDGQIIACEKKIMKLDEDKIVEQMYGPKMPITHTDTYENMLLAICFGSSSIYLFKDRNHAVYECDEIVNFCCFFDEEHFFVSSDNKLYLFNSSKRLAIKKFDIKNITVLKKIDGEIFVGNEDGEIYKNAEFEFNQILEIDGIVNDLVCFNQQLVVASGSEAKQGSYAKKKCKNILSIYK